MTSTWLAISETKPAEKATVRLINIRMVSKPKFIQAKQPDFSAGFGAVGKK